MFMIMIYVCKAGMNINEITHEYTLHWFLIITRAKNM